jgi:hypothetical protein
LGPHAAHSTNWISHDRIYSPVWRSAATHLSTIIEQKFHDDPHRLEEIRRVACQAEEQAQNQRFVTLSKIFQSIPMPQNLAQEIELFCEQWHQTYMTAVNNRLILFYMGVRYFTSIVPRRRSPKTASERFAESYGDTNQPFRVSNELGSLLMVSDGNTNASV